MLKQSRVHIPGNYQPANDYCSNIRRLLGLAIIMMILSSCVSTLTNNILGCHIWTPHQQISSYHRNNWRGVGCPGLGLVMIVTLSTAFCLSLLSLLG